MNILVNGASCSRGPNSWPYFLQCDNIVNLSCAGAGSNYMCDSTLRELHHRTYDHVIVMWTVPERYDIKSTFEDTSYNSGYQSTKNDWPKKIIHPVNDQDFVEKDWVFGCGYINNDSSLVSSGIFSGIYKYSTSEQLQQNSIARIISLQSYLKYSDIPYTFCFDKDYKIDLSLIDTTNFEISDYLFDISQRLDSWDEDGIHPGELAHKTWADIINANRLNI